MSRYTNMNHLVQALADRKQHYQRCMVDMHSSAQEMAREERRIEDRIAVLCDHLGVSRFDLDEFDAEVKQELQRRRSLTRKRARQPVLDFSNMLEAAGL